jgi:hypothetical protein
MESEKVDHTIQAAVRPFVAIINVDYYRVISTMRQGRGTRDSIDNLGRKQCGSVMK